MTVFFNSARTIIAIIKSSIVKSKNKQSLNPEKEASRGNLLGLLASTDTRHYNYLSNLAINEFCS